MKTIYTLMLTLLFSSQAFAATSIRADVNGMVCAFCAKGIEKKLKSLPEAKDVFIDLKSHIVVLELKEGLSVPIENFKNIIRDAGYEVSKAELVEKTASEIQAGMAK